MCWFFFWFDSHTRIETFILLYSSMYQASKQAKRKCERERVRKKGDRSMDTMQTTCWSRSTQQTWTTNGFILVPKTDSVAAPSTNHRHHQFAYVKWSLFSLHHSLQWILFSDIFFYPKMEFHQFSRNVNSMWITLNSFI